jgi:hypothetical protein
MGFSNHGAGRRRRLAGTLDQIFWPVYVTAVGSHYTISNVGNGMLSPEPSVPDVRTAPAERTGRLWQQHK